MRSVESVISRRNVLRTAGVVGLASLVGVGGAAAAQSGDNGHNYGNGNGIGAFLNEKALAKDSPVWDGGIVDLTGRSTVDIEVGAMTSVNIPFPDAPDKLPMAFAPRAVKVSPGTEVTWTWLTDHHSVTSYEGPGYGGLFDEHGHTVGHTFSHTFTEVGNYLYFCHPHGTPYPVPSPVGPAENLFGMRGAVIVTDE